jgi:hypothetical protein
MANRRMVTKRRNGAGESVTVYFDQDDPQEWRALEMAKLLALKHGRRKQAIIALLDAMYSAYQETGELLTATAIQNAIRAAQPTSAPRLAGAGQEWGSDLVAYAPPAAARTTAPPVYREAAQPVSVTGGGKASAEETTRNFLASMGGMSFFD